MSKPSHSLHLRVYYEDTDLAGIVYYANYLKFIERGRTELIREIGIDQIALKQESDAVFAVRRIEADYISPAKFDDELSVETSVSEISGARIIMKQDVKRAETLLFSASVTLVTMTSSGKPVRIPANIRQKL